MYFPTWIDLKGADAVPETVHHCVSSPLVFRHVCSLSVSHRNHPAQFTIYLTLKPSCPGQCLYRNRPAQFAVCLTQKPSCPVHCLSHTETVLPSSLSILHRNRPAQFTVSLTQKPSCPVHCLSHTETALPSSLSLQKLSGRFLCETGGKLGRTVSV